MSQAALDRLDSAADALRAAMESGQADALGQALATFIPALEAVRATGAWRADSALKTRVRALRARLDSDRMLARLLGDLTAQRLDLLAGASTRPVAPLVYGRTR